MSCVFCAIVAGEAPAVRIYEDDDYLAFLDIRPMVRGHTLIIPKNHHIDLTDTPAPVLGGMIALGQRVAQAARASGLHADGSNVVINDGKAAFAVAVTDDLTDRFSAVDLVRAGVEAIGGKGGGGRPDMAQGGGPDGAKANEAIAAVKAALAG